MKQTFTDIPAASWRQHLRDWRTQGFFSLGTGGVIVLLLLLGNIASCMESGPLNRTDAAYLQPPHWLLFQRLLYQPAIPSTPYYQHLLPFQEEGTTPETTRATCTITSRPRFTAVAGQTYRYRVTANCEGAAYRLLTAPAGMEMNETGFARWTPTLAQAGGRGHDVVVAVLDEAGRGTQQAYTIIAAERVHPLGTDAAGRDMLAALILGTRWTIWPGLVAAGLSLLLGVGFGGLAGYYERRANAFLSYSATLSDSLPALLLIFLAAVIFRYNLYPVMLVLGVVLFPAVARGIKARVLSLKARQFIEASRELGLSDAQILWHDIVWHNARPVLVTRLFYALALAVAVEVTLSYLRLGIQPPAVSWGNLILAGRARIENHQYWLAFWPALATIIAVAGYYLLGSGLARRFRVYGT